MFEDCLREIAGSANVDGPCSSWIGGSGINRCDSSKMNHMCGLSMGDGGLYRRRVRDIECFHFSKDGVFASYLRGCDNLDFGTADSPAFVNGVLDNCKLQIAECKLKPLSDDDKTNEPSEPELKSEI